MVGNSCPHTTDSAIPQEALFMNKVSLAKKNRRTTEASDATFQAWGHIWEVLQLSGPLQIQTTTKRAQDGFSASPSCSQKASDDLTGSRATCALSHLTASASELDRQLEVNPCTLGFIDISQSPHNRNALQDFCRKTMRDHKLFSEGFCVLQVCAVGVASRSPIPDRPECLNK